MGVSPSFFISCSIQFNSIQFSFRFLERVVYQLKGVEPIAWKLDPSVKEEALSTGWLPFSGATAASAEDTTTAA